jgi:hypothetical protein
MVQELSYRQFVVREGHLVRLSSSSLEGTYHGRVGIEQPTSACSLGRVDPPLRRQSLYQSPRYIQPFGHLSGTVRLDQADKDVACSVGSKNRCERSRLFSKGGTPTTAGEPRAMEVIS